MELLNTSIDVFWPILPTAIGVLLGHWLSGKSQTKALERENIISQRESSAQFIAISQDLMMKQKQSDPTFYGIYGIPTEESISQLAEQNRLYLLEMTKALEILDLHLHNANVRQAFMLMEKTFQSDMRSFEEKASGIIYLDKMGIPEQIGFEQDLLQLCGSTEFLKSREHFLKTVRENLNLDPKKSR